MTGMIPNIEVERKWSFSDVIDVCVKNELYTRGDCRAYDRMLEMVEESDPDLESIYRVAKDIVEHSEDQTISNVMFLLEKDAVRTFFEVQEEVEETA